MTAGGWRAAAAVAALLLALALSVYLCREAQRQDMKTNEVTIIVEGN